jgi:hypothetical protein
MHQIIEDESLHIRAEKLETSIEVINIFEKVQNGRFLQAILANS